MASVRPLKITLRINTHGRVAALSSPYRIYSTCTHIQKVAISASAQYARRGTFCRPRRRQLKGSFTDGHQKLVSSSWSWDSQNRYTGRCAAGTATATTTTWPHGYNSKKCANKWVRQGHSLCSTEVYLIWADKGVGGGEPGRKGKPGVDKNNNNNFIESHNTSFVTLLSQTERGSAISLRPRHS